jgi:7-cyano-7-deazaguanine synthase
MDRAIVLLSGGLDSATCLAIATADGHDVSALSFRYGQRHAVELEAAAALAAAASVDHVVIDLDVDAFAGSALTDVAIDVPKHDDLAHLDGPDRPIPLTYVPARNTVFLSYALAVAESRGARHVYLGVNAVDYSGYPDCRPEYLDAFARLANLATRAGVEAADDDPWLRVHAPLVSMTKAQIITRGTALGVDYRLTVSCYDPSDAGLACGRCDSCLLRARGFADAGLADPTRYVAGQPS